jgi:hypothetical protein
MTTETADNREQAFDQIMVPLKQLMPLVIAIGCLGMVDSLALAFIEQEAAKALGRPLTARDRELCRKHYQQKRVWDWLKAWGELFVGCYRDEEVIRRIVWR